MFANNVGNIDRIVRIVLGLALIAAGFYFQSLIIGLIAIIPLGTALLGTCPIYSIFGLSTCPAKAK